MRIIANSRGSALVVVLAITSVLFLGCMFVLKTAKESVSGAQSLMDKLDARIVAESMVEKFKFLGSTGKFTTNKLQSSFEDAPEIVREVPLDGTVIDAGDNTRIRAMDSGGKVNVWACNAAHVSKIAGIMSGDDGEINTIRDCLLDWFDRDDLQRLNGAESYYYKDELDAAYGPRDFVGPQSIEELSLVKGLQDSKVWPVLKKQLILAPGSLPNLNTMSRDMLMADLDISEDAAEGLVKLRKEAGHLNILEVNSLTGIGVGFLLENFAFNPSGTVEFSVEAVSGSARKYIRCLINFRPDDGTPFRVMEATY